MSFSNDELNRYAQQIKLPEIGMTGQLQLKNARVLCVGAGGLGSPLLLYLAAMGIGKLGIVDHDQIELSNLQRQVLYQTSQIGSNKAFAAHQHLNGLNPHLDIETFPVRLAENNANAILGDYDFIADCSDNFATRYLVNDVCRSLNKPLVAAAIHQFKGQCMTFTLAGACLRCVFPIEPQADCIQDCANGGVLGLTPGWFGILQAMEIIKIILQLHKTAASRLIRFDMLNYHFSELELVRDLACTVCANQKVFPSVQPVKNNTDEISYTELTQFMQDQHILLLDVRSTNEHAAYNIGGTLFPVSDLVHRFPDVDKNKMIICYCQSGKRSQQAIQLLRCAGFTNVKSLRGGIQSIS